MSRNSPNNIQTSLDDRLLKTHINDGYNADPTDFLNSVGGIIQKWKNLKNVSQKHMKHTIPKFVGEEMGELVYALKNCKRSGFPIYLDPKTSSFIDVALHAKIRQYLSDNTIIKNIRYARFMETHPCSVDFRE